jgi:hypothetical protein
VPWDTHEEELRMSAMTYMEQAIMIKDLEEDCIRLQQEINCLRMEPCQLPHCVKERDEYKRLLKATEEILEVANKKCDVLHAQVETLKIACDGIFRQRNPESL